VDVAVVGLHAHRFWWLWINLAPPEVLQKHILAHSKVTCMLSE